MARPITWQDVAAPRGLSAAIEVYGRGGDRLAQAVGGMGEIVEDFRNDKIKTATDAAVATIATSTDPTAAASAVPKDWTIDPLAVAVAANARGTQLQQARAVDQNILASQAQVRQSESAVLTQEANRKDIEDKRRGAELAQPFLDQILSGKYKGVGPEAFKDQGQGGVYAQEAIQNALKEQRDYSLRANESNLRMKALREQDAPNNYLGWAREFGASAEGQLLDAKELDRRLVAEAKRRGLPATFADSASTSFGKGLAANGATDAELDTRVPGANKTYRDGVRTLTAIQSDVEAQKAAALAAPYDPKNPDKPDSNRPSLLQLQELATRAPAFQEGPLTFVANELAAKAQDMDASEARDRIAAIRAEHPHLTVSQAADLALQSEDRWFDFTAAGSPEVKAGALMYKEVDRLGGKAGVDRIASERTAKFDRVLGELPTAARQLSGAARTGTGLPTKILEWDSQLAKTRAQVAAEEADAAALAAKRASQIAVPYVKSTPGLR